VLTAGASPTFDGTQCANTYCHGSTLAAGGTNTTPRWTVVDGTQAACGTCHGAPPPAPHPFATTCNPCHGTIEIDGTALNAAGHINGVVEVSTSCDSCHGSSGQAAPPRDTAGHTAVTARGVGAHQNHLAASTWHAQISCTQCHAVPATLTAAGHIDTPLPAELTWGPIAMADGAMPSFNGTTCTGSYCHGTTLQPGGTDMTPAWTIVDGSQAYCGSCHGLPPGGTHPSGRQCQICHSATMRTAFAFANPALHINGIVDVSTACDSCHGSGGDPAPPRDTTGATTTSTRGVGAHQSHLGPSTWHAPIECTQCHVVPTDPSAPGHMDTAGPAELTWGPLATSDGATPAWDGTTCAGAYCHGATLQPGGTNTTPDWTTVDGSQAACGTCHGLPPGGTHPTNTNCELCHSTVMGAGGTIVNPALHINGVVDVTVTGCDSCHGSGGVAAPPTSTTGGTATSLRGVGAHRSHLGPSTWHAPLDCTQCHIVPASLGAAGHTDTPLPAEVTWSGLAVSSSATPAWNGTTCAGTYCHGSTLGAGGSLTSPTWTTVDGTQAACGTCHAAPPPAPHPA
ncbi:MAG: CxxxxCH/CxxCH domain-containing protein, partial [Deltaproteobacteria bacterium]